MTDFAGIDARIGRRGGKKASQSGCRLCGDYPHIPGATVSYCRYRNLEGCPGTCNYTGERKKQGNNREMRKRE